MADLWHYLPFYDIGNSDLRVYCKIRRIFLGSEPCAPSVFIIISDRDKVQVVRTRARLASLRCAIFLQLDCILCSCQFHRETLVAQRLQNLSTCKSSKCLNSL